MDDEDIKDWVHKIVTWPGFAEMTEDQQSAFAYKLALNGGLAKGLTDAGANDLAVRVRRGAIWEAARLRKNQKT
jgi:hypothetical protein